MLRFKSTPCFCSLLVNHVRLCVLQLDWISYDICSPLKFIMPNIKITNTEGKLLTWETQNWLKHEYTSSRQFNIQRHTVLTTIETTTIIFLDSIPKFSKMVLLKISHQAHSVSVKRDNKTTSSIVTKMYPLTVMPIWIKSMSQKPLIHN
jgi:hypothetical protein